MKKLLLIAAILTLPGTDLCCQEIKNSNSEAKTKIASKEITQTRSTETVRIEDRYFFTTSHNINKYVVDMPEDFITKLRNLADKNTVCAEELGLGRVCRELRPTIIDPKDEQYFRIKSGFLVAGFKGSQEAYRGQVANLKYAKYYNEGYEYVFEMQLTRKSKISADIYIIAQSFDDLQKVKPISSGIVRQISDTKRVLASKKMFLDYYGAHPQRLTWWIPDDRKPELPSSLTTNCIGDLPQPLQLEILSKSLQLEVLSIRDSAVNSLEIIKIYLPGDADANGFCIVNDDKIQDCFLGNVFFTGALLVEDKFLFEYRACGEGDSGCDYSVLINDGQGWHRLGRD